MQFFGETLAEGNPFSDSLPGRASHTQKCLQRPGSGCLQRPGKAQEASPQFPVKLIVSYMPDSHECFLKLWGFLL